MSSSAQLELLLKAARRGQLSDPGQAATTREEKIREEIAANPGCVNRADNGGKTLLHHVFQQLDDLYAVIHELLDAGASPNIPDRGERNTPLMVAAALQYDQRGVLEKLIRRAVEENGVDKSDRRGWTSLHKAAHHGNADVVRMLLEARASPDLKSKGAGVTPLMLAVSCDRTSDEQRVEMTRQLLAAGADVNATNITGHTSLMYACRYTELETAELLRSHGASVTNVGKIPAGFNILLFAVTSGSFEMVRWLVKAGADVNYIGQARCGPVTALKIAINRVNRRGNVDMVRYLLERGADPNITNAMDGNILSHGVLKESPHEESIIKLLLDRAADMYSVGVRGTKSPLERYVSEGRLSVVRLLLENGLDLARYNPETPDDFSPLHMAISLDNGNEMLKLFLEYNSQGSLNLDHEDNDGFSPLCAALRRNSLDCVKLLLQAGANVNYVNSKGNTALELISSWSQSEFKLAAMQLLEEAGAKIDEAPP